MALGHLVTGFLLCLTIIGIPLGLANFKIIPVTPVPLGVRIVPGDGIQANCGFSRLPGAPGGVGFAYVAPTSHPSCPAASPAAGPRRKPP